MEKHRHCRISCPLHSSFAKSLRKYPPTASTPNHPSTKQPHPSSRSSSYIKPFRIVDEESTHKKNSPSLHKNPREIQSLIGSVIVDKNTEADDSVLVKNKQLLELQANVGKISGLIDKFKALKDKRCKQNFYLHSGEDEPVQNRQATCPEELSFNISKETKPYKPKGGKSNMISKLLNYKIYSRG